MECEKAVLGAEFQTGTNHPIPLTCQVLEMVPDLWLYQLSPLRRCADQPLLRVVMSLW